MKAFAITVIAALLSTSAMARDNQISEQDCQIIYRPGVKVVTRKGSATIVTCNPLLVRYPDGAEASPTEIFLYTYPPPLDYPHWAGTMIDPNFLPMKYKR
jgi:hypothetical protein